jgi:hypothetical protein
MKAIDRPFTKIINGTTQFVIPVFLLQIARLPEMPRGAAAFSVRSPMNIGGGWFLEPPTAGVQSAPPAAAANGASAAPQCR